MKLNFILQSADKSVAFTSDEFIITTDLPYSNQGTHDYSTSAVLTVFGGLLFIIAFVVASLLFRCRCCYRDHERQTTSASNSAALRRHQQTHITTSQSPNPIDQHIWHLYQIPPLEPPPAYDAAIMLPICTVPKYVPNENSDASQL